MLGGAVLAALCLASMNCDSPAGPSPVCSIVISPASLSFGGDGGTGTVNVTAPASCTWTAMITAGWITITAGVAGSGPGNVVYSVASNPSTESRSATMTVGGQSHGVTQQGRSATCSYELTPANVDIGKDAGSGTFSVTAPAGCGWTATSNASWLVVTSGSQGSGNGSVAYTVAANAEIAERSAGITVAGQTFAVRQSGDVGACQYSVSPVDLRPCMPAGGLTVAISTHASCPWTAQTSDAWLGIPSGGTGSSDIAITFSENYLAPREGIVMLRWPAPTAGQNVRVAQAGCLYFLTPSDISVAAAGGSGSSFDVHQQSEPATCGGPTQDRCTWSAVSNVPWITISGSMPRTGDDRVFFSVTTNTGTAARVGRITVGDKEVVITQAGQ
jgi:hypothetical protein